MVENDALELETRRRIYEHIRKTPGSYLRELSRFLEIPLSTVEYHISYLKQHKLISEQQDGRYMRYYVLGDIGEREKAVLSILRQRVPRCITLFLLIRESVSHADICDHIKLSPSTATFHLKKLLAVDIIKKTQQGIHITYQVNESKNISDLLITYRTTFLDDAVDRFIGTWLGLNPEYIKKSPRKKSDKKDE